jgi:hypothetical protein
MSRGLAAYRRVAHWFKTVAGIALCMYALHLINQLSKACGR